MSRFYKANNQEDIDSFNAWRNSKIASGEIYNGPWDIKDHKLNQELCNKQFEQDLLRWKQETGWVEK